MLATDRYSSLLNASPAFPWGSKGHEIVAAIAESQLNDEARNRIKELLPRGTTVKRCLHLANKAGRQIPDVDAYHYINFPKARTHIRPAARLQAA